MPRVDASRRRRMLVAAAGLIAVAVTVTLAAVWPGYDAQQTPLSPGSVWAMQNGSGSAYARVNLDLGEVDTVKQVENGSALAQTPQSLFVFSDAGTRFADVDLALPPALTADAGAALSPTPAGTVEMETAGDFLVYRTDDGEVYAATLSGGGTAHALDPYADDPAGDSEDEERRFVADAIAVDERGGVFAYSAAEGQVLRADAGTARVLGLDDVPAAPAAAQLTAANGRWVLIDEATGDAHVRGRAEPVPTDAAGTLSAQKAAGSGDEVFLADSAGLVRIDLDDAAATRVVDDAPGSPVAPVRVNGRVFAAWLGDGSVGGLLWSSGEVTALDYGGGELPDVIDPVFVVNGDRAALNERRSGWVWTVPDGRLVASSQRWTVDDRTEVADARDELTAERVIDPRPPVAVPDAFGVRAGTTVRLPVLLNDHDPNEDVLSVDPESVQQPDPAFGGAVVTGAEQELVVHVAPDAAGTGSLAYRTSDGTAPGGRLSEPAAVALTVVPDDVNTAPVWCGVADCLATWPQPVVTPGGTVSAELLGDWVDPEGDALYLAGASVVSGDGAVTTSPDGTLTYQHPDPAATQAQTIVIQVVVSDVRGATATREIAVTVAGAGELVADPFAVTGVTGEPVTLDIARHVRGATGRIALTSAAPLDDARSTVALHPTGLSADLTATEPGSYLVQYTVHDGVGEATALARVVVRDADEVQISTPPLTAFVRPGEDATVDVLPPVHNPAGLVLLVGDVRPQADPAAALSVDTVGQSLLRVSGSTQSGEPGLLGVVRYTVSDGSGREQATTTGELTVVLLPAGTAEPPIAVDDAVTVRAGDLVDIPVMDNDTAPAGALFALDPSGLVNESGGGLAFATPRVVRFLAPAEPGIYGIGYTIYRVGFPEAVDTARIVVTVTGDETNQAPAPAPLEGRVLSGESVRIPFSSFGVDPDGDTAMLDGILTQPEQGSAAISADGQAIVYTSPAGFHGQLRFTYQVRDARGATGAAEVRIGVLDAVADPRPITFSDYIQIQAGQESSAVLRPAENDIDPAGGALSLVSVTPAAPVGTPEHEQLADRIGGIEDDAVTIAGGAELGSFSYVYVVRNEAGDTASGLIVVKVVRERVPNAPVVTDTVLTLESRDDFPRGVDVLSGRVTWPSGDASGLALALWGDQPGVSVDGRRISGDPPETSLLIPFEVSGTAFDGTEVSSYGFLRVPGARDIRLSLRAGTPPLDVREDESAELDMAAVVAGPTGERLQIDPSALRAGGARASAACVLVDDAVIRYDAGAGAPWTDTCIVPVRIAGQEEYTYLTVPVRIEATRPQPLLRAASITVDPGQVVEYDLGNMVEWSGPEDGEALAYAASHEGDQLTVELDGAGLRVVAREDARPGYEETISVSLPGHPETPPATMTVTIGPAPQELPRGGTAEAQCSQASGGTSCAIAVIGAPGEVNPLPTAALTLVSASGSENCPGVTFQAADDRTVLASWPSDHPGAAECTGSFVVEDAQGRRSSGDREGRVILDLQGLPTAPTRLDWIAFDAGTVALRPVSEAASYPEVTGYEITRAGQVVATCPASGECPAIDAPPGVPETYSARAVNAVGLSAAAVEVTAWPYRVPERPAEATFVPVPAGDEGGHATITVTGIDATTDALRLTGGRGGERTVETLGGDTVMIEDYDVGANEPVSLTVTPLTHAPLPPIPGGGQEGAALAFTAHGVGAPAIETTIAADGEQVTVTITTLAQSAGTEMRYGFSTDPGTCRADGTAHTRTFEAPLWEVFTAYTCAQSVWSDGRDGFGTAHGEASIRPSVTIPPPTGLTYGIETRPQPDGAAYEYRLIPPTPPADAPYPDLSLVYEHDGERMPEFALAQNQRPGALTARWCHTAGDPSDPVCSEAAPVTPTGSARYPVRVEPPGIRCAISDTEATPWLPAGIDPADVSVAGEVMRARGLTVAVTYTVSWRDQLEGLGDIGFTIECTP